MALGTDKFGRRVARRISSLFPCCALLPLLLLAPAIASANTSLFNDSRICTISLPYCQALSNFGVLQAYAGATNDISINGNWALTDIALGGSGSTTATNTSLVVSGSANTVSGVIDFANTTVNTGATCTGTTNFCGSANISPNTYVAGVSSVTSAVSQLSAIETKLGTYSSITSLTNTTPARYNVQTSMAGGAGGVMVYSGTNWTPNGTVTFDCGSGITCNANDLVIIQLSYTSTTTISQNIVLGGGLTSDQVIFYVTGGASNRTITFANASATMSIAGDWFFHTADPVVLASTAQKLNISGHVFSDLSTLTFASKGGTQTDLGPTVVPEPSAWLLMASGLGAALWLGRRRRQNPAA